MVLAAKRLLLLIAASSLLVFGAGVSIRLGQFLRATSIDPAGHRDGDPFFIPMMGLTGIASVIFVIGAILTEWAPARSLGHGMIKVFLPIFVFTCFVAGAVARYAF